MDMNWKLEAEVFHLSRDSNNRMINTGDSYETDLAMRKAYLNESKLTGIKMEVHFDEQL
ncbi:hypothetical protein [Neobacillus fumarioli]|uniref:hypothetical protein n=1 Tax=Neobacillus fumarioli TaxID=105229 RepID=UPI000AA3FEC8|nr:hypothetical protein [Neobacillus fumarioli]